MSQVSLGRPELFLGRLRGIPTAKFLYVIFLYRFFSLSIDPGEKRHININFLLWLTSRWPWDKRLVVPELTGPKSSCVRLETQEI